MKQRIYTASTLIVSQGKVLLHFHPKFQMWLQMGGHIEPNELPHEAALREAREETNFDVKLYLPDPPLTFSDAEYIPMPMHIVMIKGLEGKQFVDFLYYASTLEQLLPSNPGTQYRWFSPEELNDIQSWTMPENIRYFALEAIKLLNS